MENKSKEREILNEWYPTFTDPLQGNFYCEDKVLLIIREVTGSAESELSEKDAEISRLQSMLTIAYVDNEKMEKENEKLINGLHSSLMQKEAKEYELEQTVESLRKDNDRLKVLAFESGFCYAKHLEEGGELSPEEFRKQCKWWGQIDEFKKSNNIE